MTALNPLFENIGQEISVRTTQGDTKTKRQLRFGKLVWNARSHNKWTHESPDTAASSKDWKFYCGEVWCPSWTTCEKEKRAPELFISFENPFILQRKAAEGQFNQLFHLALPIRLFQKHHLHTIEAIERIQQVVGCVLCVMRVTPWSVNFDSIQSALNNHVHYIGMQDDMIPDLSKTRAGIMKNCASWMPYDPTFVLHHLTETQEGQKYYVRL